MSLLATIYGDLASTASTAW